MRKNNHQYWKNNSTTHQPRQTTRNRDREMAPSELTVRQEHSANGTAAFAETLVALCILHELTCSNHCTWKRSGGLCCRYSFATGQRGRSFRPISLVISCNQGSTEVRWRPGQDKFEPKVFLKQIYCIGKGSCDIVGTFRRLRSVSAPS